MDFFKHNTKILTSYVGHEPLPIESTVTLAKNGRYILFLGSCIWKEAYQKSFRREILGQSSNHEDKIICYEHVYHTGHLHKDV
jgi:hypothetical protein